MSVKIGTRYICPTCESEFIVTKAKPEAELKCCKAKLEKK